MSDERRANADAEQVEAALEATCDALIALQLARALTADPSCDLEAVRKQLTRTTALLRQLVDELRAMLSSETSDAVDGFVLRARRSGAARPTGAQSKPRRTA